MVEGENRTKNEQKKPNEKQVGHVLLKEKKNRRKKYTRTGI